MARISSVAKSAEVENMGEIYPYSKESSFFPLQIRILVEALQINQH
jgi:hypothetical protein